MMELRNGEIWCFAGPRRFNCIAAAEVMADRSTKKAVLRVRRGTVNEESRYDDFEVPFEEGMSVLDALRWIRANLDSSLAIRYSCINANACKTCMALVNGEVEYTCIAKLTSDDHHSRAASQTAADPRFGDRYSTRRRKVVGKVAG